MSQEVQHGITDKKDKTDLKCLFIAYAGCFWLLFITRNGFINLKFPETISTFFLIILVNLVNIYHK
jgi:hypothetical protein